MSVAHFDQIRHVKDQIRDRVDIVEVVGKLVTLTRKGPVYKGICPFHSDRKPSLTVSQEHRNYRCWSCGEHGDVFTFIERTENVTFMEALETLAERFGVPYERRGITDEAISNRQRSLQILANAEAYYCSKLCGDAGIYLDSRGLNDASIEQWGIGYAPDSSVEFRTKMNASPQDLIAAGLMRQSDDGRSCPIFNNRIMFPIRDIHGTTIGFGGRAMGGAQPKYINSPQSAVFNKSAVLYGLDRTRKNKPDKIVIAEGYLDVILEHQWLGINACSVAPMGTALTDQHAKILAPLTSMVVLGYDADNAGRTATSKSYLVLKPYDMDVRIATFPDGEDPASMLALGAHTNKYLSCIGRAEGYIDYQISQIKERRGLATQEERTAALNEIITILAGIDNSAELGSYVTSVANLHPLYKFGQQRAVDGILRDIQTCRWKASQNVYHKGGAIRTPATVGKPKQIDAPDAVPISRAVRLERALLSGMFSVVGRPIVVSLLNPQHLITPEGIFLYGAMLRFSVNEAGCIDWLSFMDYIRGRCVDAPNVIKYLEGLLYPGTSEPVTENILHECVQYLAAIHADMVNRLAATSLAAQSTELGTE